MKRSKRVDKILTPMLMFIYAMYSRTAAHRIRRDRSNDNSAFARLKYRSNLNVIIQNTAVFNAIGGSQLNECQISR